VNLKPFERRRVTHFLQGFQCHDNLNLLSID
jgi:hypothetical protein